MSLTDTAAREPTTALARAVRASGEMSTRSRRLSSATTPTARVASGTAMASAVPNMADTGPRMNAMSSAVTSGEAAPTTQG